MSPDDGPIEQVEHIDQIERLICRKLDGELTTGEELELNKLLIRWPQCRRLLENYLEQDRLAAEVLAEEVGWPAPLAPGLRTAGPGPVAPLRPRASWKATSAAGLLVACLALVAVLWQPGMLPVGPASENGINLAGPPARAATLTTGERFQRLPDYLELPQTQEQEVTRQFIGVHDRKTGRYYILEIRRESTNTRLVSRGI